MVLCHGTRATRDLVGQKSIGEEGHGKVSVVDIGWLEGVNTTVRQGQVHSAVCTGRIHNLTAVLTVATNIKPVRFKGKCIVVRFEIVGGDVAVLRPDDRGCHVEISFVESRDFRSSRVRREKRSRAAGKGKLLGRGWEEALDYVGLLCVVVEHVPVVGANIVCTVICRLESS